MLNQKEVFERNQELQYKIEDIAAVIQNDFEKGLEDPTIYTEEVMLTIAQTSLDVDNMVKELMTEIVKWGKDVKAILKESVVNYRTHFIKKYGEDAYNKAVVSMQDKLLLK